MDLNQLAVFVRVVDSKSFTRAARFLKQPKSRVSRRIAALEAEMGASLLYRTTRQFSLTDAGRALYEQARQQIYDLEATAQLFQESAGEVAGLLRVTAVAEVGTALLGPLIAELNEKHPKLVVDLHLGKEVVDLVKEGIDLAIRVGELEDATLKVRALGEIAMVLVAGPDYLKKASRIQKLQDLAKHPALVFITDETPTVWKLQAERRTERVFIRTQSRSNDPEVILQLALEGQGVALLPEFYCAEALKQGHLKRVLEPYRTAADPIQFVWPAQRELNPKVRAFVDLGVQRLSKYFAKR